MTGGARGLLVVICVLPAIPGRGDAQNKPGDTIRSVVSSTAAGNGWSINYPKQRKLFVMAGRVWVFYSDGGNGVYRTSRDGRTWSRPTIFAPGGHLGHRFGCWFDGTHFHYCLCTAALGADVYYRRGAPRSDGKLTWSGEQQVAFDTPEKQNVMYPKIIVDSEGYPWITFMQLVYQVPNAPPYDAIVIKSSTRNGKWKTASGFPFYLVSQKPVAGYPDPVGVPLTGQKTCWIYNHRVGDDDVYAARIWNGKAWEDEEIVASPGSIYAFFSAVSDGDDVHVVHGAGTIRYRKRTWGAGWGEPFDVDGNASGHTSVSRTGSDRILVTWLDTAKQAVCYRERVRGKWGATVAWIDASAAGLPGAGINSNCLVGSAGRFKHAVVYSTGKAPPFAVEFAGLKAEDR